MRTLGNYPAKARLSLTDTSHWFFVKCLLGEETPLRALILLNRTDRIGLSCRKATPRLLLPLERKKNRTPKGAFCCTSQIMCQHLQSVKYVNFVFVQTHLENPLGIYAG